LSFVLEEKASGGPGAFFFCVVRGVVLVGGFGAVFAKFVGKSIYSEYIIG